MAVSGQSQTLISLSIRATEYTVGKAGPASMPGKLPPSSGYTYAVELSADEAIAAGATTVTFSKPLVHGNHERKVGRAVTHVALVAFLGLLDAANRAHVSYVGMGQFADVRYAHQEAGSWVVAHLTTGGSGDSFAWTSIAVDSSNQVHACYFTDARWPGHVPNTLQYRLLTGSTRGTIGDDGVNGDYGRYNSLAVGGGAHVTFHDNVGKDLRHATNASGAWVVTTVDSDGDVGTYTSLAVDGGGKLHVSYHAAGGAGDLKYATNASGAWVVSTVDSAGFVGEYSSLALDAAGKVHIVYYDTANGDLKYATNASGAWVATVVDSAGDAGLWTAMKLDSSGKAHVSYYDATNRDLKYATNAFGAWITTVVDGEGDVGAYSSLALDSAGRAHISYHDATHAALKVADNQ
jgi:hypothetical protein